MKIKRNLALISFACCMFFLSRVVVAESIENIQIISCTSSDCDLQITWHAVESNRDWDVKVSKLSYLGPTLPVINVETDSGDESLLPDIQNCYYTGTQNSSNATTVFVKYCDGDAGFTGFVSSDDGIYGINGTTMTLLETGNTGGTADDTGSGDNGKRTKGASNSDPYLQPRNMDSSLLPSLEFVIEPSYITSVGGQDSAIDRIMENLALTNMMYERYGINLISLKAILILDKDITTSDSQGNILNEVEKLRKQNIQQYSGDVTMFLTGKEFSQPYLWGWSESGYACALQQAVDLDTNLNTHTIGKSAGVMRDLPTLMQRGWILAHEVGHSLGAGHWVNDALMDGGFQPDKTLEDYSNTVHRCDVLRSMLKTCAYDPKNKKFTDFYECL